MQDSGNLIHRALAQTCGEGVKVLDFGCGQGALVEDLRRRGYDAHGCDIFDNGRPDCAVIEKPYRPPFADSTFDAIVSTSVLEHAQNPDEAFREWYRCLKPGGRALHLFPSKWYLPVEPHIHVPQANVFWPGVPRWWLGLWAFLGVRNPAQRGMHWRNVRELNVEYCRTGLNYRSNRYYAALASRIFGNYAELTELYLREADGGTARLLRRLPRGVSRRLIHFRAMLIGMRKPEDGQPNTDN